jgi:hypothetical protein
VAVLVLVQLLEAALEIEMIVTVPPSRVAPISSAFAFRACETSTTTTSPAPIARRHGTAPGMA